MGTIARSTTRIAFNNTIASVSSAPIASVGLALAIYLYEVHRMSAFQSVAEPATWLSVMPGMATLATLLVLGVLFDKNAARRIHRHTATCFTIASIFALSLLLSFGAVSTPLVGIPSTINSFVMRVCETLLLLCWGEVLLLLTARQAASIVATSLIMLGLINALSSMLKASSAGLVIAMLPILSVMCLYWFKDRAAAMNDILGSSDEEATVRYFDRSLIPDEHNVLATANCLNFLLPLLCCPIVFGFIHYAWIPSQDNGATSTYIQLSAAMGSIMGGAILYLLTASFWGRRKLALYNLFTLLFMMLSFAMVGFSTSLAPYPYVVTLNIAQKIAFFFVWMAPFLIPTNRPPLTVWCFGLGLYQTGKIISNISATALEPNVHMTLVTTCVIVLVIGNVLGIVLDQGPREWDGKAEAKPARDESGKPEDVVVEEIQAQNPDVPSPAPEKGANLGEVCAALAKQYRLSRREEDVLALLAQGMVARDIAETLVISNSTAKTHMRNLYAKMDVHSQTELILLISQG